MKKTIIIFIILLLTIGISAQKRFHLTGTAEKKITATAGKSLDEGAKIVLLDLKGSSGSTMYFEIESEDNTYLITYGQITNISFDKPHTLKELWNLISINSDFYRNQMGKQYDLRHDLDDETIDFINTQEKYNLFFEDEYLEENLQSLLFKIHPITLSDERPGNLNIKILKSKSPNAICCPNGTILISTGLLSTINSEEELYAVLSHEVAHFVLDHHVVNYNIELDRQKRAVFWAGLATAAAAAMEIYMAAEHEIYTGGSLTLSTAILSSSIAASVMERLGAKYTRKQELEADMAAKMVLEYYNINPNSLASALSKIYDYCVFTGDYYALSGKGTYPALLERIKSIGEATTNDYYSQKYHKLVSFVTTFNAIHEFNSGHLLACNRLVDRNIEAGVATEDDYILKAMVCKNLYDTPERNMEALSFIEKAKSINVTPKYYVFKQEGLTLLRLNRNAEAKVAFTKYLESLNEIEDKTDNTLREIDWTKKMIYKSEKL